MEELLELERKNDLMGLITRIQQLAAKDKRIFTNPFVKHWCARRWRYFFLNEAISDLTAIDHASKPFFDRRSYRQRAAEYYLLGEDRTGWLDEMPDPQVTKITETTLLFCPGMLNGMRPMRAFGDAMPRMSKRFSLKILRSDNHPLRSCEANMADILAALNEGKGFDAVGATIPASERKAPDDVFLVTYSKGAPDTLTLLANHPDLAPRVRCLFTWAGAVGGSETADEIYKKIQYWGNKPHVASLGRMLKGLVPGRMKTDHSTFRRLDEYDTTGAVRDLTTKVRDEFMKKHGGNLDRLNIPIFYLRGAASKENIPLIQRADFRKLQKFDPQNDMQVTAKRAAVPLPMATDLGLLNAHHWDLSYPAFSKRRYFNNLANPFPKEAAITAMSLLAAELGLVE